MQLKARFEVNAPNTLFLSDAEQKNLPIDDVPELIKGLWKEIKEDKELDVPNYREILANHRCNEIKEKAY